MKNIRHEVTSLKPEADAIEEKAQTSASEDKLLEKFHFLDRALYQVLTDRLQALYGWDKNVSVSLDT
jgi:hypothetical protein